MANIATTIDEQIAILNSRGMSFSDLGIEKAKELLLDIGYYRLGFYWHYFEIDDKHNFAADSTLLDAIKLYYLDVDLRNILSKYLYRIEVNFRTKVIYYVSNKYNNSPTWFNDSKIVEDEFINQLKIIYNSNFIKYNYPIKKHHSKYINDKYAPAWKTLEFFTFGQVFKLFKNLKDETLKLEIANTYGIKDVKKFENHISSIINVRNICSHSAVLFDFNQPKGIHKIPSNRYKLKTRNQTNLNSSIRLILFYLSKVSQNRAEELEEQLKKIIIQAMENQVLKRNIDSHICFDL